MPHNKQDLSHSEKPSGNTGTLTLSIEKNPEYTLAQAAFTNRHVDAPPLCSGLGACGKCRMRITEAPPPHDADLACFSSKELQAGWRLGCRHRCSVAMTVEVPVTPSVQKRQRHPDFSEKNPEQLRLAVDLGTTSIHWQLLELCSLAYPHSASPGKPLHRVLASGSELNPQMGAGSDVMSRLLFAMQHEGLHRLQQRVHSSLQRVLTSLQTEVREICVAGNAAMTYLLLGLPVSDLASAPYRLSYSGGSTEQLTGLPPIYIPPLPAPFVGGDLSAGITALQLNAVTYPFMLVDLGTNGEFILALSPDKALLTSVALGPALEGIGLTFGTVAGPGAITGYTLTPTGLTPRVLPSEKTVSPPAHHSASSCSCPTCLPATEGAASGTPGQLVTGISGTGYLSLINQLKKIGLLENDGRFATSPLPPLAARFAKHLRQSTREGGSPSNTQTYLQLDSQHYITAGDIEEVLKVKAAFSLAFERLLQEAKLTPADLTAIYLGGALGEYTATEDLEGLGFIPAGFGNRVQSAGNTSLAGAVQFLVDPASRTMAERWTANTTVVDLTADATFTQNYMRHMRFTSL